MRVACPECAAEYDLPPSLAARLGEGRTVRCARCGHAWAPEGVSARAEGGLAEAVPDGVVPVPAPALPEMAIPDPPAPARPGSAAPTTPEPTPPRGTGVAWAASLLVLAAAAGAAWHWRLDLVEAWPPAARAFVALGLAG